MHIDSASRHITARALLVLLTLLACLGWPDSARASDLRLNQPLCHAVRAAPSNATPPTHFSCRGVPTGYQHGSLWLRAHLGRGRAVDDSTLVVRNSRFDRIVVTFGYADGSTAQQQVRSGDFGSHWRPGGQIAFTAPVRDAHLTAVTLRFDRLASAGLLRIRLLPPGAEEVQFAALATAIGAALTLLLIGAIYNASLAIATRRQFPAWQSAWAACVLIWGAIWAQLGLFLFPGMAGAVSAQVCTGLSCLAVTLATMSAVTALGDGDAPRRLRRATVGLGVTVGVLGIPLMLVRSGPLEAMANALGLVILADLAAVATCLVWAWRRGSPDARMFIGAWSLPMLALGVTQVVDIDRYFWGGGSQILVLMVAAWQTLWLSVAATRSYSRLRVERDRARSAEEHAHELARRDPLTGLRNRRGFIEAVAPMLDRSTTGPLAFLLVDVDHFKSINDTHGHEAGDEVLVAIARRIGLWEGSLCTVARMGGEEFALMLVGVEGFALARFADNVRKAIAACDHGVSIGPGQTVTVSIGVAEASGEADFRRLYRLADEALYLAKRQGRNQVVLRELGPRHAGDGTASELAAGASA